MKSVPKKLKRVVYWSLIDALLIGIVGGIVGHTSPEMVKDILQMPNNDHSLVIPGMCVGLVFGLIIGGVAGMVNPPVERNERPLSSDTCATCGRSDVTLTPCMSCGQQFCEDHGTHYAEMFACPQCLAGASRRIRDAMNS